MNLNTVFYLVRHGETEWNVKKITQGHQDSNLTLKGLQQAKNIAEELKEVKFDKVFSSDLLRAKRTAEIIAIEITLAVNTTQLLRERAWGNYEGKPAEVFKSENKEALDKYASLSEKEKWSFRYAEGIESNEDIYKRLVVFLREAAVTYPGSTILIVTHGGIMRSLLLHLGWGSHKELRAGSIDNTGYIKVSSDGVDFFIDEVKGVNKLD